MAQSVLVDLKTMYLETCYQCKTQFCMSAAIYDTMSRLKEKGTFHCPLGHAQHYVTGEHPQDILRRENERLKQEQARLIDERREALAYAKTQIAVHKGKVTRIKNRVHAGVCPDCNRSFSNVAQHMKTKHSLKCEDVA